MNKYKLIIHTKNSFNTTELISTKSLDLCDCKCPLHYTHIKLKSITFMPQIVLLFNIN